MKINQIYFRQNEHPPSRSSTVDGDLPPLSGTGSPTAVEKDILVCRDYLCMYDMIL